MLTIGMCGYEKSDICMFPRFRFTTVETSPVNDELQKNLKFRVVCAAFYTGNVHRQKKASNKQEFLPTTFICGTFMLQ